MRRCPECGNWCPRDRRCSRCGEPHARPVTDSAIADGEGEGEDWVVVARFANAAEAGYFANELDYVLGVEPRLDCRDDFDANHHHWRSGYVLSVPGSYAESANELLRRLLDTDSSHAVVERDECLEAATPFPLKRLAGPEGDGRAPVSPVRWAPLFLTLAAGSLAMWHGKKPAMPARGAPPADAPRMSLRDAPGLTDAPWVQSSGDGVRRELRFSGANGAAVLREDRDADGVFEREIALDAP